jgi:ELWxxDGT repeat protein
MSNLVCSQQKKLPQIIFLLLILILIPGRALPQCELLAHPNRDTTRNNSLASVFFEFKGKVYFSAFDQMGYALYCTDGTPDRTLCLTRDIIPGAFAACGEWLYVYGSKPQYTKNYDNPWAKYAIWRMKADGSERQKLTDLFRPYSMNYNQTFLWSAGNRVYYS